MTDDTLDAYIQKIEGLIAEYGWAVQGVGAGDGDPQFSYTVGLTALGHPEIIIESLPPAPALGILNIIGGAIKEQGRRFEPGDVVRGILGNDLPLAFIEARKTDDLTVVGRIYGTRDALQAVWCDTAGRFPWDEEYGMSVDVQPLLGVVPDTRRDITLE